MVSERESLAMLENSLRETLQKEATESDKRRKAMEIQKEVWEQHRQVLKPAIIPSGKSYGEKEEEVSMSAMTSLRAKEQEIEKRKLEVSEKVQAHLSRVEEEARRLDQIRRVDFVGIQFKYVGLSLAVYNYRDMDMGMDTVQAKKIIRDSDIACISQPGNLKTLGFCQNNPTTSWVKSGSLRGGIACLLSMDPKACALIFQHQRN
eukprot:Gb_29823 [translate_table: standard]